MIASFLSQGNQTPPSTAENDDCSDSGNHYLSRSAVTGLWQSNSHGRTGTESTPAFLRDEVTFFTERRQPRWLRKGATAEKIKGDRHDTAGMQWNVACGV